MRKTFLIFASLLLTVSVFSQTPWSLTGNAGTTTSNFLGTTDNNPLLLKVNNQWAGFTGYSNKNNVSFGYLSLTNALGTGGGNTAVGAQAMQYNSASFGNVAIGVWALQLCTSGDNNVAVGASAMYNSLTTGSDNVAIGQKALSNNMQSGNTVVGSEAAFSNTTGAGHAVLGYRALCNNTTGDFNTAIGYRSLSLNTTGFWNAALGSGSLQSNSTGYRNAAGGNSAMWFNTTGYENAAFGEQALSGSIDGHYNTAIGCRALWSVNQTAGGDVGYGHGNNNTAVGYESLREITTGSSNVGVGMHALRVNSSGSNNIAMGNYSLTSNTTGGGNVAIGDQALYSNTEGGNNVAVGNGALRNSTTTDYVNIAVGTNALYSNTTGGLNTAVGTNTLQSNTTGFTNVAIGYNALQSNTEGGDNTANGYYAMENNIRGSENCAYGAYALYGNTTGSDNTAIGHSALYNNITGFGNTAVGVYANTGNCGNDNIAIGDMAYAGSNNSTAIGAYAQTTADNQVMIGNSSVTSIRGYVPWTTISDGRVKKNIRSDVPGLAFIKLLQPVTYNLDTDAADKILKSGKAQENENDSLPPALAAAQTKAREAQLKRKQTGFVAQDVEKAAQSIGYDFSGVDADESGAGLYGLRYSEFIVPLVKAVQELSAQNDAKDSMIVSMQHRIDQLEEGNDATTVSALKQQVETLTGLVNQLLEKGNNPSPDAKNLFILGASLEQNFPNPFNHSTTIKYTLPQEARSGKIVIADLSGRVFKQIPISKPGSGSVTIEGGSLYAGTYYYSLYVDNTLIDTKKMVLTK